MSDFTNEIVQEILKNYNSFKNKNAVREMLENTLKSSDFSEVYKANKHLCDKMAKEITSALQALEGDIYKGTLIDVLKPCMEELHADIEKYSTAIQANKNYKNGIRLKAQTKKYDSYDAFEMANEIIEDSEGLGNLTGRLLQYASQSVDEIEYENITFLDKIGDNLITVTRKYDGVGVHNGKDACTWCIALEGTKTFRTYWECMDDDIWRRHHGCGCEIDYECVYTGTKTTGVKNYR